MTALQTSRWRTDHTTCMAILILKRGGAAVELRCGLAEHGGGMHLDTGLGPGLWWSSAALAVSV